MSTTSAAAFFGTTRLASGFRHTKRCPFVFLFQKGHLAFSESVLVQIPTVPEKTVSRSFVFRLKLRSEKPRKRPIGCAFTRIRSKLTIIGGKGGQFRSAGTRAQISAKEKAWSAGGSVLRYQSVIIGLRKAPSYQLKTVSRGYPASLDNEVYFLISTGRSGILFYSSNHRSFRSFHFYGSHNLASQCYPLFQNSEKMYCKNKT